MRVVVTGTTGQLVRGLVERGEGRAQIIAVGRPVLDLERPDTIASAIAAARPDVVVNAAAFTAVDEAESRPAQARMINAVSAGEVALTARRIGVPVIQLSTDYVFDGRASRPATEEDAVAPLGVYGETKLAGERAVAQAHPDDHVVLRTSWVHGPYGRNFVRTMLRLGAEREDIPVVSDQWGCPTYAPDLADAVLSVAEHLLGDPGRAELRGIFHAAGSGETSWAGFAEAIFAEAERLGRRPVWVRPILSEDYPTAARRPMNSRLDCAKLARFYGVRMLHWRDRVGPCVARLLAEEG